MQYAQQMMTDKNMRRNCCNLTYELHNNIIVGLEQHISYTEQNTTIDRQFLS